MALAILVVSFMVLADIHFLLDIINDLTILFDRHDAFKKKTKRSTK